MRLLGTNRCCITDKSYYNRVARVARLIPYCNNGFVPSKTNPEHDSLATLFVCVWKRKNPAAAGNLLAGNPWEYAGGLSVEEPLNEWLLHTLF